MRILILILALFSLFSCSRKKDPQILLPPSFNELPDPNNPEKPSDQQSDSDIEKLKELLLKDEN